MQLICSEPGTVPVTKQELHKFSQVVVRERWRSRTYNGVETNINQMSNGTVSILLQHLGLSYWTTTLWLFPKQLPFGNHFFGGELIVNINKQLRIRSQVLGVGGKLPHA